MIQRIQSLYLLGASVLAALFAFLPLFYISVNSGELFDVYALGMRLSGTEPVETTPYILAIALGAAAMPFLTIFMFKRRMLQIRLCAITAVLLVGCYVMIGAYFMMCVSELSSMGIVARGFHPAVFAPALSLVCVFFAARAIMSDELLVRSVDRIR